MIEEIRYRTKIDSNNIRDILKKIFCRIQKRSCSFLEIGCDIGQTYEIINTDYPDILYVGIDINEEAIRFAKEKYQTNSCQFECMDAANMSSMKRHFDIIFARMLFEDYVQLEEGILSEMLGILNPDGLLCIHFIGSVVPFVSPDISILSKFRRGCKILENMNHPLVIQAYQYLISAGIKTEIEFLQRDTINPGKDWLKAYYFSGIQSYENDMLVKLNLMSVQELQEYNETMRKMLEDNKNYICFMQALLWAKI